MTNRNLIIIPNHPSLPSVSRKAVVTQSCNNYLANSVIVYVDVIHYINGIEANYFPKSVCLSSDNNTRVNPQTGEILTPNQFGEYEEANIGQYDYFWTVVNELKAKTQVELEEIYILLRIDFINEKLYK